MHYKDKYKEKKGNELFVGILIPKEWEDKFYTFQKAFPNIKGVRWVKPKNVHMTLLFMGVSPNIKTPHIKEALKKVAERNSSFELIFDYFKFNPHDSVPTAIWAQFKSSGSFELLSKDIVKAVSKITLFEKEARKSFPHLTLAKIQGDIQEFNINAKMKDAVLPVTTFSLVSTRQGSYGEDYTVLETFNLRDA